HVEPALMDPLQAQAARRSFSLAILFFGTQVVSVGNPDDRPHAGKVDTDRRLGRLDHDLSDPHARFSIDEYTVPSFKIEVTGKVVGEMACRIERNGNDFGPG